MTGSTAGFGYITQTWLPLLAAITIGVQVGISIVLTRAVADDIGPVSLTFLRYAVAALCLVPVVLVTTRRRIGSRDILPIAMLGLVQFGLLILLLNMGLRGVPAGPGALLFATSPLFALVLGVLKGQERWSGRRLTGIIIALTSLTLVLGSGDAVPAGVISVAGATQILGAAACAAVAGTFLGPFVRRYGAPPVSAVAMLATVAMLAGPALANDVTGEVRTMDDGVAGAVVALGIGSGIGYLLWLWALKSIDASTVTAFLMLSPVTALIAGAIFLDEAITITAAVGMALLGAGLWASTRARPKA